MKTDWIHYFGYGSLVNRQTRPAGEEASSAHLVGWRRVWNHRVTHPHRGQPCTSLSIEPSSDVTVNGPQSVSPVGIDGVIVRLPRHELEQLDAREAGYDRLELPLSDFRLSDELARQLDEQGTQCIMVYRSQERNRCMADEQHPVLRSYVDCVMAGYLQRFAASGLQDMVASTRGWELPVLNDRAQPFYPRSVAVDAAEQDHFDSLMAQYLQARLPA